MFNINHHIIKTRKRAMLHLMMQTINSGSHLALFYFHLPGIDYNLQNQCHAYRNRRAIDFIRLKYHITLAVSTTSSNRAECQYESKFAETIEKVIKKLGIYKKLSYICRKRTTRHQLQNTIIDNIIPLKKGTLILKNSQMNIGHKIREVLDAQHRTPLWMADRMGRSKASVYDFFRKKSINTGILVEICHLLHHDFFADISEATKRKRAVKLIPQRKTK